MGNIKLEKTSDGLVAARAGNTVYAMLPRTDGRYTISAHYGASDIAELSHSDFAGILEEASGIEDFMAYMTDVMEHLRQKDALGRYEKPSATSTPWGKSQGATVYVENGIVFHSTARHGGFKVSARLNREIPEPYRNENGWYEEDCEYAKVIVSLPAYFTDREVRQATETVRNWFPDEYEAVTGEVIPEGESFKKDERLFKERHAHDWIVISAVGADDGMVRCVATKGGERQTWNGPVIEEREFLVPSEEYSTCSRYGFVIDPNRHERIDHEAGAPRP